MFRTLEVPILGVIENMSYLDLPDGTRMDIFGSGGGEKLAQATQTPFLGKVPIDQNVRIGGDSGKPIVISYPDSPVAKALREITESLAAGSAWRPWVGRTNCDQYCGMKMVNSEW